MNKRILYGVIATGGVIGLLASFAQSIEKIQLLQHSQQSLTCDLNSVFSCSNVLHAWQSSVFGFPNSFMCMVFFTIFMSVGLVGLAGGTVVRWLRLGVQALSLFVLGFALWFFEQCIFRIHALCVLCLFCFTGLLLVNAAWLRLNADDLPIGERGRAIVKRSFQSGADIFVWLLLAAVVGFVMFLKFS